MPEVLDREEVEALKAMPNVRCPTGLRNRAILEIMHGAGLRVSEVCALRPQDVRTRPANHTEGPRHFIEVRQGGKGKVQRTVPIAPKTMEWLELWRDKRPKSRYFFCTLKGGPVCVRYLQQLVKRLAAKAGIERRVTPHRLRHSYATELLEDGFSISEVQLLLGHRDVDTTQVYLHVRPNSLAAKIAARFQEKTDTQGSNLKAKADAIIADAQRKLAELGIDPKQK